MAIMRANDGVLVRAPPAESGSPLAGRRRGVGGGERSLAIMRAKDAVVAVGIGGVGDVVLACVDEAGIFFAVCVWSRLGVVLARQLHSC